jgi:hypothetical protein
MLVVRIESKGSFNLSISPFVGRSDFCTDFLLPMSSSTSFLLSCSTSPSESRLEDPQASLRLIELA